MIRRVILAGLAALIVSAAPLAVDDARLMADAPAPVLADYRLFADAGARRPAAALTPYTLNTPLFSDYAEKLRFVYLPSGSKAEYRAEGVPAFPVGTVLVKTFAYPADFRAPSKDMRFIETRLLIRKPGGWTATTYVWNDAQDNAVLKRAGARVPVSFVDASGKPRALDYGVPNTNQCKQCHSAGGELTPIGPTAGNLNGMHDHPAGAQNQLAYWTAHGLLADAPKPHDIAALPRWDDATAPVAARARAYLDVNCGHCHSRDGFASNSGLYLGYGETNATNLGVGKRPVAAGRGSGGREVSIDPGHPDQSILLYRMEVNEPGMMMPQFGRTVAHTEAVALVHDWIAAMKP